MRCTRVEELKFDLFDILCVYVYHSYELHYVLFQLRE